MIDIKQLAFDKSLSQRRLADIMGTTQSEVSQMSNGNRKMLMKHEEALIDYFGAETINQYRRVDCPKSPMSTEDDNNMIEDLKADIKAEEAIPVVPDVILSQRDLDIQKYVQSRGSELLCIDPRDLVSGAEFAMEILKDSMAPDIVQGDTVFLQFLPPSAKLHSGSVYFIDTPAYAGMIRDVFIDGDKMTLKARNRKFGDIVLDTSRDTYKAANILGIFRRNFNSAASQIEEVRREKDNQMLRMLDVVERQAKQNGKLIDYLTKK